MKIFFLVFLFSTFALAVPCPYPESWWARIDDPKKPSWEILPQEAKFCTEVILSKRNELGIFSNFAATPFEYHGKKYASVEGFWQMMKYPEEKNDPRAKFSGITWPHTREEVGQMIAFDAKHAGDIASENMKKMGIDWVSFEGKHFPYMAPTPGEHSKLIWDAERAKLAQNPKVRDLLLKTDKLILRPDHTQEPNAPPEWEYFNIWMKLRDELKNQARQ